MLWKNSRIQNLTIKQAMTTDLGVAVVNQDPLLNKLKQIK